jgi:hypothetical protein
MVEKHLYFAALFRDTDIYPNDQFVDHGTHAATGADFHFFMQIVETPIIGDPAHLEIAHPLPPGNMEGVDEWDVGERIPLGYVSIFSGIVDR